MAEGGIYPWKIQSIDCHRGKAADYSQLMQPLPDLPKGLKWFRNADTREWSVVSTDNADNNKASVLDTHKQEQKNMNDEEIAVLPCNVTIGQDQESDKRDAALVEIKKYRLPEGCDYLLHSVQETDTFQGICLKYKLKATVLRQANYFSGNSLLSAPDILVIPLKRNS